MSLKTFLLKAHRKYGNRYDYSKVNYINYNVKVCIICSIHGEFFQKPHAHLSSNIQDGCKKCSVITIAKKKSYSINKFIEIAKRNHNNKFDYSLINFNKLTDHVIIICPIHGQFKQKANIHIRNGCKQCANDKIRLSKDYILNVFYSMYPKNDYSLFIEYKTNKQKIFISCKEHGSFSIRVDAHLQGKNCAKCNSDIKNQKLLEEFIKKSKIVHNNKFDYSNIKTYSNKVNIICPIHGEFKQYTWNHLNNDCPKCSKENRRLTLEEFLEKAKYIHGDKYNYSQVKFKHVCDKINIICYKHGIFKQRVAPHIYKKHGCPKCSKIISKDEIEWLNSLNIPKEYRNKQLIINNKSFYPDAYDIYSKTIYEYYGDYWHGNLNIYDANSINKINKMKFIDLYNRTVERENFFKQNGYTVISIWETDWLKGK
jgi:hypothetical protein